MKKDKNPNPNGKNGEPITLAPYSFDDVLRKIPGAKPDAKPTANKPQKKHTK